MKLWRDRYREAVPFTLRLSQLANFPRDRNARADINTALAECTDGPDEAERIVLALTDETWWDSKMFYRVLNRVQLARRARSSQAELQRAAAAIAAAEQGNAGDVLQSALQPEAEPESVYTKTPPAPAAAFSCPFHERGKFYSWCDRNGRDGNDREAYRDWRRAIAAGARKSA